MKRESAGNPTYKSSIEWNCIQKRALTVTQTKDLFIQNFSSVSILHKNHLYLGIRHSDTESYKISSNCNWDVCICDNDPECIHLKNVTANFPTLFHWNEKGGNFKRIKINNNNSLAVVRLFFSSICPICNIKCKKHTMRVWVWNGGGGKASSTVHRNSMNDFYNHFMTLFRIAFDDRRCARSHWNRLPECLS